MLWFLLVLLIVPIGAVLFCWWNGARRQRERSLAEETARWNRINARVEAAKSGQGDAASDSTATF